MIFHDHKICKIILRRRIENCDIFIVENELDLFLKNKRFYYQLNERLLIYKFFINNRTTCKCNRNFQLIESLNIYYFVLSNIEVHREKIYVMKKKCSQSTSSFHFTYIHIYMRRSCRASARKTTY